MKLNIRKLVIITVIIAIFGYMGVFSRIWALSTYMVTTVLAFYLITAKLHFTFSKDVCYVILLLLYAIWSTFLLSGYRGALYCFILFNGLLFLELPFGKREWRYFIKAIEIVAIIFAIYTIINVFNHELTIRLFKWMLTEGNISTIRKSLQNGAVPGLAGEVSYNAFCIILGMSCVLADISSTKDINFKQVIKILILFVGLFLTYKRTLFVTALLLTCIALISYMSTEKWNIRKLLFVVLFIVLVVLIGPMLFELMHSLIFRGRDQIIISDREVLWKLAYDLFRKQPIFGNGINTYDIYYNLYLSGGNSRWFAGAHNSYLQFLAEIGFVGTLLFLAFIISNIKNSIQTVMKSKDTIAWFSLFVQITVCIYALTGNPFHQPQQIYAYFAAVSILRSCKINNCDIDLSVKRNKYENSIIRNRWTI